MTPIRYQLPNGLTVVLQESRAAKVVAFQAWVGVGSADEPLSLAGIAHVFEHMLFKGTARRGVGQIAEEVEAAGGDINAWTAFDQTVYHLVIASRYFDTGLDILADALQHSAFDPQELERELKVVLEEIKQGEDSPARVATQALFGAAYARHPYRRPVIGTTRTVASFTRPRLLDFFRRWYVANNVTLVVVGDFDSARARRQITAHFGKMSSRPLRRRPHTEPRQTRPRVSLVRRDVREVQLGLAFHIPGIQHEDTAALDLLAIVLGQGDSSRLTLAVKRGAELVTEAYAYSYTPRDPGLWVVGATLPLPRLAAAEAALLAETLRLRDERIGDEELAKAKAIIEADAVYQKETVQGQARKLGFFEAVTGGLAWEAEYGRRVRELSAEALRQVAARYLTRENATVAALVPESAGGDEASERGLLAPLERAFSSTGRPAAAGKKARAARLPAAALRRVELPSGARLLVQRDPSVELVALRAVWMGGLRYENAQNSGVNHLLAALVTRGTRRLSGDALAHEIETLAGSIGGFSGRNSFGLRGELLARHWQRGLELFAECIRAPALAPAEIEKERRQLLEELRTQADCISTETFRLFHQTLYGEHPYRLDVSGSDASVRSLTQRRLRDFYASHMAIPKMTLAIVGDIDPDRVLERAAALFEVAGTAPPPPVAPPPPWDEAHPVAAKRVEKLQNRQQAHLVYGFPGITLDHPDRFALEVLATVLSGQGGRLFRELRDRRGLVYQVSAFSVEGVDPGYFAVYLSTSPANLDEAVAAVERELARMATRPVSQAVLARVQRYLVGTHEISLQRRAALASTLAFHEAYGVGWDEYLRYADNVTRVTAPELLRVARRYLRPERAIVATVRPGAA